MTKILARHTRELLESGGQSPLSAGLTQRDCEALVNYDRSSGYIVPRSLLSGDAESADIVSLREEGVIQRLLACGLIYPTGKLTPLGMKRAAQIELMGVAQPYAAIPVVTPPAIVPEIPSDAIDDEEQGAGESDPILRAALLLTPATEAYRSNGRPTTPAGRPVAPPARTDAAPAVLLGHPTPAPPETLRAELVDPNMVALHDPGSYEAEQFKILRTNILYPVSGKPPRTILVTSSAPGEGKTFTAANLAISIALNINKHVLLIDADLRRPQLHRRFGLDEDAPGLCEHLERGAPIPSLLLKTPIPKLTLLPGGRIPINPSELISSERMTSLLDEVTQRYADRLIVIDSPPPRLAAETGVLARLVDGILVVVRYAGTRREDLTALIKLVGPSKIIGGVVNYMQTASSRYYGYKYGGYPRGK